MTFPEESDSNKLLGQQHQQRQSQGSSASSKFSAANSVKQKQKQQHQQWLRSRQITPDQISGRWFAIASTDNHWFESACLTDVTAEYAFFVDGHGNVLPDAFSLRNESVLCSICQCNVTGAAYKQTRWISNGLDGGGGGGEGDEDVLDIIEPEEYWVKFSRLCGAPTYMIANELTRLWNWLCCTDRSKQDQIYHYDEKGINPGIICHNGRPPMIGSLQILHLELESTGRGDNQFLIVGNAERTDAWLLTRRLDLVEDQQRKLQEFSNMLFDDLGYPFMCIQSVHSVSHSPESFYASENGVRNSSQKCFRCNIFLSCEEGSGCCCGPFSSPGYYQPPPSPDPEADVIV